MLNSDVTMQQPEDTGAVQHGAITQPVQSETAFQSITVPKFAMAKGGTVESETQRLFAEGGLKQEGNTTDPVSGNKVPFGSMQEEVRDDVPAQLSEGEFVFPADVVRYIGLERLMMMRQAAKEGLGKMEDMGQMSNAEEATEEDTGEFESQIDEIIGVLGGREPGEKEEGEEEDTEMAEGGMVEGDVTQQTQQAFSQAPQTPAMAAPMATPAAPMAPPAAPPAAPMGMGAPAPMQEDTQEVPASKIIAEDTRREGYTAEQLQKLNLDLAKVAGSKAVVLREKNTILVGTADEPGVLTTQMFSTDTPEDTKAAVGVLIKSIQKANIKGIRGETRNEDILAEFEAAGFKPDVTEENGTYTYYLDMQPKEPVQ